MKRQSKNKESSENKLGFARLDREEKKHKSIPTIPSISEAEFTVVVRRFETMNSSLSYGQCLGCRQVRLGMKKDRCTIDGTPMTLSVSCQNNREFVFDMKKKLPV